MTVDEAGETRLSVVSGPLVGPVLRRVVSMLAARADLPLDRLDDAVLVADVIAARAPAYGLDGHFNVAMRPGARTLAMRVGPLLAGGARSVIEEAAIPELGNVIEQLADDVDVHEADGVEFLNVSLAYKG